MARLSEIKGKPLKDRENEAYVRCFGSVELSELLSRAQSPIIRNGFELEKIITTSVKSLLIDDLDTFLDSQIMHRGIRVATKKVMRRSEKIQGKSIEPDFIIFERKGQTQTCYIIELKDGHEFDTKSSAKEQANLSQFLSMNSDILRYFHSYGKICGFHARTKEEIQNGFKGKIDISQAMTGAEFCDLLRIDYQKILKRYPQKPRKGYMGEVNFPRISRGFEKIPVPKLEFLRVPLNCEHRIRKLILINF